MTIDTDDTHTTERTPTTRLEAFAREHASKLDQKLDRYAKYHTTRAAVAIIVALTIDAIALILLIVGYISNIWYVILFDLFVIFVAACYAASAFDNRDRAMRARQSDDILVKCEAYVSESDDYDWNLVHPITDALKRDNVTVVYRVTTVGEIINRDRPAWHVTLECETFDSVTPATFTAPRLVRKSERFVLRHYDVVFDPRTKSLDIHPMPGADWVALDPSDTDETA